MKANKDICVLTENNTYYFINNTDSEILYYAKKDNTKYIFFPIYSKGSIKYYKEDASVLLSPISISIDATLLLCSMSDNGVNFREPRPIHLKANSIAESYSLLGSLYNIEYCCEILETECMNVKPELVNFEIRIYVDEHEYFLDTKIYEDTVKLADEDSIFDSFVDYGFYALSVYNLIGYIENTISYKSKRFYSLSDSNEDYILFTEGNYAKCEDNKSYYTDNAIVLCTSGSPMYLSVLYSEYSNLASDHDYMFSYVVYDPKQIPEDDDYIPDENLTCQIILELSDYMYEILLFDDIHVYTKAAFIFALLSVIDISEVLLGCADCYLTEDISTTKICYTASLTWMSRYDSMHTRIISDSITNNIAKDASHDILQSLVEDVNAVKQRLLRGDY